MRILLLLLVTASWDDAWMSSALSHRLTCPARKPHAPQQLSFALLLRGDRNDRLGGEKGDVLQRLKSRVSTGAGEAAGAGSST